MTGRTIVREFNAMDVYESDAAGSRLRSGVEPFEVEVPNHAATSLYREVMACIGTVNATAFEGHPPGTVLFNGIRTDVGRPARLNFWSVPPGWGQSHYGLADLAGLVARLREVKDKPTLVGEN